MVHGADMPSTASQQPQVFTDRLRAASRHVHSTSNALVSLAVVLHVYDALKKPQWSTRRLLTLRHDAEDCTASEQVNAKLLVAFTRIDRYGLALSYFEPVFSAIEMHCQAKASSPGVLM